MEQNFKGFVPDTYRFLMELGFFNEKAFYHANRERCKQVVLDPMRAMALDLTPKALEIDPNFNTRLTTVVSRMNRDTRYTKDKRPYRDHCWLGFRLPNTYISESLCVYFEVEPSGYGYGMGMYGANSELMKPFRARVLADPQRFLDILADPRLQKFKVYGEPYKRDRFPDAPEAVKPYINRKGISWGYFTEDLTKTYEPELFEEVLDAFDAMKPLYRFMQGLEV
ncbi:MAG: DUF2461 domain-containing protein [Clostridia bacterium]|nr:DUF2461 domain-containing protein [Clostridia bacterium]MBQ7113352.1 DUF2461 domain-containing protein [Clostridia bacterium]